MMDSIRAYILRKGITFRIPKQTEKFASEVLAARGIEVAVDDLRYAHGTLYIQNVSATARAGLLRKKEDLLDDLNKRLETTGVVIRDVR